jgi:hypothetical protein
VTAVFCLAAGIAIGIYYGRRAANRPNGAPR